MRLVVVLLGLLSMTACQPSMNHQPKQLAMSVSEFFPNHNSSRKLPKNVIARGQLKATSAPTSVTRALLKRGQAQYEIFCSVCHGADGEGRGMAVLRGFPAPPSYHIDRLRNAPLEHFYSVITTGYGVMYSYADRVTPEDRWAIAQYIRTLQYSQYAKFSELPAVDQEVLRRE